LLYEQSVGGFLGILCSTLTPFSQNCRTPLLSFTVLPLIFLAVVLFRRAIRPVYLEIRRNLARVNAFIQEHLTGIKVVQAFTQEKTSFAKFEQLNRAHKDARLDMVRIHAIFMPTVDAFSNLAISVLLFFGAVFIYRGSMEIGMLIAFLLYCRRFYRPVMDLSQKYNILQDAMTSSARIFDLMDTHDHIPDPIQTALPAPDIPEQITYRDVWFAYNSEEWVLKGINLTINQNEKVALVGLTGEGKTTIVNLLARLYDYQQGSITLAGVELRDMPQKYIRKHLAYVHQDVFLFAGTILDNIRLWQSDISEEDAIQAARTVNLDPFVRRMPRQYHEPVLEGGSNLSTGQKQLISFARALAFKPKILILDEATSNIDSETEQLIQEALDRLMARQTSIIIAHRLSTIKKVNRILVVQNGKIAEQGSHEELLERGQIYARLYQLQFQNGVHLNN
ncbi:ABC transporter ATP-binding protein, partial [bacterium]|nr:ABC transporter ATP-binding protein [bacterium]